MQKIKVTLIFIIISVLGITVLYNHCQRTPFQNKILNQTVALQMDPEMKPIEFEYKPLMIKPKKKPIPNTPEQNSYTQVQDSSLNIKNKNLNHLSKSESLYYKTDSINNYLVNINQATIKQWIQLPGIGPNLAEKIVLYRSRFGYFMSVEDLTKVDTMTVTRLNRIRDYVCCLNPKINSSSHDLSYSAMISINQASLEELILLPGVGHVIAQSIIEYREENGPFHEINELLNVARIGPKKLEKIKDLIIL